MGARLLNVSKTGKNSMASFQFFQDCFQGHTKALGRLHLIHGMLA